MKKLTALALALSLCAIYTTGCGDDPEDNTAKCDAAKCTAATNSTAMACENNACVVSACAAGYKVNDTKTACVEDNNNTSSTCVAAQCTKPEHAKEMYCAANACAVKACDANYKVDATGKACVEDKGGNESTTCEVAKCEKPAHAKEMQCVANACAVKACDTNYKVDATGKACVEDKGGNESTACDSKTFQETCSGSKLTYCYEDKIVTEDCDEYAEYYDEDAACVIFDKVGYCMPKSNTCTNENKTDKACYYDSYGYPVISEAVCTKGSDGKNYWIVTSEEDCDDGDGYCSDSTTCHAAENCTESYPEKCEGDVLYSCEDGLVYTEFCEDYGEKCHVFEGDTKITSCVDAADTCDEVNKTKTGCESLMGIVDVAYTYTCLAAEDGHKYYVFTSGGYCANACNEAGTDCDAQGYMDEDDE